MTSRNRVRMVVVVPAFTTTHQSHPPVVTRVIASFKAAGAPQMRGGVDQPGGVQSDGHAEECSPEEHSDGVGPAAPEPSEAEEQDAAGDERNPMVLAQPDVEAVAYQVGDIAR